MNENQKKVTDKYRNNWDTIFKKKEKEEFNYLEAVDRDEARYNHIMGRSGVRWAGD